MLRILAIDDSRTIHAYLEACFSKKGHQLVHAHNPKEGLELVRSKEIHFDLILLDWEMPEMTGPEVVQALKREGFKTPVIMMTTRNKVEDIRLMMNLGASEYVMKPFTADILFEKIEGVLSTEVDQT